MVEKEILKTIYFLENLPELMLDKLSEITTIQNFKAQTVLFENNQDLKQIYMLVSGTVYLKIHTASDNYLVIDKVTAGRTFGIAALMKESSSSFSAVCKEDCSIITISAKKIHQLFEDDFKMGHILMLQVVKLFKARMERHTNHFLESLLTHPEIKELQETDI